MKITEFYDSPDSTYFRTGDAEPAIAENEIRLVEGRGSRRSWGAPQVNNTVIHNDCDFCAVLTGFSHKHGGGQFYRYFVRAEDGQIERRTWARLTDDERQLVLDGYEDKAPHWAKRPGKLSTERCKPSLETFTGYKVMRMVDAQHFTSLFDSTTWELGKRNGEACRENHGGGYYVHPNAEKIVALWQDGKLVADELVTPGTYALVACECSGRQVLYSSGKVAVTYCKPTDVMQTFEVA